MKKLVYLLGMLFCLVWMSGCGGMFKNAKMTDKYSPYDTEMNCEQIRMEQEGIDKKMLEKQKEKESVIAANIMFGVTGVIFFPPLLFLMDFSTTEVREIDSMKERYDILSGMGAKNNCEPYISIKPEEKSKETNQEESIISMPTEKNNIEPQVTKTQPIPIRSYSITPQQDCLAEGKYWNYSEAKCYNKRKWH